MPRTRIDIDPWVNDPGRWAHSLVNLAELIVDCLNVVEPRSIVEVGAYAGDLTTLLVDWGAESNAQVRAIDPFPQDSLVELDAEHDNLEVVRETSFEALARIDPPDVAIIDGDHNYYTVSEELRLIKQRTALDGLPLLMFHDVCWPHGRRDDYYAPETIPEQHRQPIAEGGGLVPGLSGIRPGGLPYRAAAAHEGGPRNGVLTAVEDFVAELEDVRLAIVPVFFGLGVVWRRDAPWANELEAVVEPWDRNPLLARLEANRVLHLANAHLQTVEVLTLLERKARQEAVLRRLLESSAFSVAERLSRLRMRLGIAPAQSVVSKEEIGRVLAG